MGLSLSTTNLTCLPYVTSRGRAIYITLRSLEDRSGAFDVPKAKCPPDRGSSNWVTASSASFLPYGEYADSPASSPSSSPPSSKNPTSDSPILSSSYLFGHSSTSPKSIPVKNKSNPATPSLTPDNGSDYSSPGSSPKSTNIREKDALDFLMTLFPSHGLTALSHSNNVTLSAPNLGVELNGVVLHVPGTPKTLYVDGKSAHSVNLRDSIVALLDLADENLGCDSLVIVLERSSPHLRTVLHSLMYVGGVVVTRPLYPVDPAYVLVGLEI